jgi:hypothetical protein
MTSNKPAARVIRNIWGNHICFLGRDRVAEYGGLFDAKFWLATKIKAGHPVAKTSLVKAAEVQDMMGFVE